MTNSLLFKQRIMGLLISGTVNQNTLRPPSSSLQLLQAILSIMNHEFKFMSIPESTVQPYHFRIYRSAVVTRPWLYLERFEETKRMSLSSVSLSVLQHASDCIAIMIMMFKIPFCLYLYFVCSFFQL